MIPKSLIVIDLETGRELYPALAGGMGGGGSAPSPPPPPMYRHPVYSRYSNASMPFPYSAAYENPKHAQSPTAIRVAEAKEQEQQQLYALAVESGFRFGEGEAYETREQAIAEYQAIVGKGEKKTRPEYTARRPYVRFPGMAGYQPSGPASGLGAGGSLAWQTTSPYLGGKA